MLKFIASVGSLIPGLFGVKLSYKAAKVIGFVLLAALAVGVVIVGKLAYDASILNRYKTEQAAAKATRDLSAERAANAKARENEAKLAETQTKLDEAAGIAEKAQPVEAAKAVGPVTQSYYDTLRKEKK